MEKLFGGSFMQHLRTMMRWAHAEGILASNPLPPRAPKPRRDAPPPAHFTPSEAQRYYHAAPDAFKPPLALAMFAGLRVMEACRLDWSAIHVGERRIRIAASVTKVRRGRIIEGVPTILWAQLALFEKSAGPLVPGNTDLSRYHWWNDRRRETARRAQIDPPSNVFRHSFATYFTALTGNPALTARVLGHTDLVMLARHYDGLAKKSDAEDYFHPRPVLALPAPAKQNPAT